MKDSLRYIQLEDYLAQREKVPPIERECFDMAYLTGARASELLSMKKGDLNYQTQTMTIHTLKNRKSPIRYTRLLPMVPELYASVQAHALNLRSGNLFQFPFRKKPRIYLWEKAHKYFGCTTHSFRHTHATLLVRDFNANIHELMNEMGWSDMKAAAVYVNYGFSKSLDQKVNEYYTKNGNNF